MILQITTHIYKIKKKPLHILQIIKLMLLKKAEAPGWEAGKTSNGVETFYLPYSVTAPRRDGADWKQAKVTECHNVFSWVCMSFLFEFVCTYTVIFKCLWHDSEIYLSLDSCLQWS